ncbi:uncharacterized protein LOC128295391 [Gossypium arboreum]|uniref:uncharacterized protein LOC128295391 n=1 Tax=Gossypium arboreum TaxID=29729 RepID=UPI0022F19C34|nr:uncharacterized protein LOC128295391 [Gossypium arboreum]
MRGNSRDSVDMPQSLFQPEVDNCKRFLRGLRDEIKLQLVSQRITEMVDLIERAKMVEQVLGFIKKTESVRPAGKRTGTTISNPQPKRPKEYQGGWRFSFRSDRECGHCGKRHLGECWKVTRGCFHCGSTEHFVKDCPKNKNDTLVTSQKSVSTARGRGLGRGSSVARGGAGRRNSDIITQQSEARVPARAYVVKTHEEGDAHDVVTGIFLLYFEPVYALIDPGSSHSYINSKLIELRKLKSEMSRVSIEVSSPLGQTVLVNQVCPRCPLIIQNKTFPVDLLIMPFGDFDIIFGHGLVIRIWGDFGLLQKEV